MYSSAIQKINTNLRSMDLDYYLWSNGITQKEFAKKIGMAPHSLNLIVNKKNAPTLLSAINIHRATKGEVTYEEMLKDSDKGKLIND